MATKVTRFSENFPTESHAGLPQSRKDSQDKGPFTGRANMKGTTKPVRRGNTRSQVPRLWRDSTIVDLVRSYGSKSRDNCASPDRRVTWMREFCRLDEGEEA